MKDLCVCTGCGCTEVQMRVWKEVNTGKLIGDCEEDTVWCPDCDEHRPFEYIDCDSITVSESRKAWEKYTYLFTKALY
jgi:hypothetical protein